MFGRRPAGRWLPAQAAASLARLAFVERGIAQLCAGWAVKQPAFDAKLALGLQMHRSMERSAALAGRVVGLTHATGEAATIPAGWRSLLEAIDRAPSPDAMLAALYGWLFPRLAGLYADHLRHADPLGDRASIDLIGAALPRLRAERRAEKALAGRLPRSGRRSWSATLGALWDSRECGDPLLLAEALWPPVDRVPAAVRPEGARLLEPGSLGLVPADPLNDADGIAMLLHKEIDEEFTTLELIARNSYEHPDMPPAFHRDMARQASDEARHAMLIARLMQARGIRHGDYPLSTASYDGLYQFVPCAPGSREELLWRMLIRQTFDEGLALDNLALEIERRSAAGQADIAAAFAYILRDEVFHAGSGLRWSRELAGPAPGALAEAREAAVRHMTQRAEAAREQFVFGDLDRALGELASVEAGKAHRRGQAPRRPLNRTARGQAGFSEDDLRQIVDWGYASDPAGTGS